MSRSKLKPSVEPIVVGVCGGADCGGPMLSRAGSTPRCERCHVEADLDETEPRSMAERLAAAERLDEPPDGRGTRKPGAPCEVGACACGGVLVVEPRLGAVVTCAAGCRSRAPAGALGDHAGHHRPRARDKRRGW